jgi:hypothetical protein
MHASQFHASFDAAQVRERYEDFIQRDEQADAIERELDEQDSLSVPSVREKLSEKKKAMLRRAEAIFVQDLSLFGDKSSFIRNVREWSTLGEAIAYSRGNIQKEDET